MHALAQINLTELPFKPAGLDDLEFITIFMGPNELPVDAPNGTKWMIPTYTSLTELIPLEMAESERWLKPFPMKPRIVESDYPCWEDIPVECLDEIDDD